MRHEITTHTEKEIKIVIDKEDILCYAASRISQSLGMSKEQLYDVLKNKDTDVYMDLANEHFIVKLAPIRDRKEK